MGGHSHSAPAGGSQSSAGRFRGQLAIAFGLTAGFFVVELIVGLISGSLALVADAGHMATDVVALGASLIATRIAGKPDSTGRRTYGRYRAEVFAAGLACLLMFGVGAFVLIESLSRSGGDHVVSSSMLVVGILGLLVNLVSLLLLRKGSTESINMRGAYLEVLGDAAGSVGVIVAAILISVTGNSIWDVIVALAIGLFVIIRAVGLARSVLRVLGQHTPVGLDLEAMEHDLLDVAGVAAVHDIHVWELTSGMNVATAHLVVTGSGRGKDEGAAPLAADFHSVLDAAQKVLADRYGIEHATLQVEPADHDGCGNLSW
ncbi:cation transporter [Nakamurella silvestris]|nr:cation transporter [Nakamurella silvestris]